MKLFPSQLALRDIFIFCFFPSQFLLLSVQQQSKLYNLNRNHNPHQHQNQQHQHQQSHYSYYWKWNYHGVAEAAKTKLKIKKPAITTKTTPTTTSSLSMRAVPKLISSSPCFGIRIGNHNHIHSTSTTSTSTSAIIASSTIRRYSYNRYSHRVSFLFMKKNHKNDNNNMKNSNYSNSLFSLEKKKMRYDSSLLSISINDDQNKDNNDSQIRTETNNQNKKNDNLTEKKEQNKSQKNNNDIPAEKKKNKPLVIVLAGPTAVGKSAVASNLCTETVATRIHRHHQKNNHHYDDKSFIHNKNNTSNNYNNIQLLPSCDDNKNTTTIRGHIVSADSVQTYRGVTVGANKPTQEELQITPHHLIDILDGSDVLPYSAADWMLDALHVLDRLTSSSPYHYDDSHDHNYNHLPHNHTPSLQQRQSPSSASSSQPVLTEKYQHLNKPQHIQRRKRINEYISQQQQQQSPSLPIVVGGTMMYIQWLIHGRPDAKKPTIQAVQKAHDIIQKFQQLDTISISKQEIIDDHVSNNDKEEPIKNNHRQQQIVPSKGWQSAIQYTSTIHPIFEERVHKLSDNDWYRLRRTLEIAYTVLPNLETTTLLFDKIIDDLDNMNTKHDSNNSLSSSYTTLLTEQQTQEIESLYNGQREGGIDPLRNTDLIDDDDDNESPYDVRCFFLCPDDRMAHAKLIDFRCEDMLIQGLLRETTNLYLSGQLPDGGQQARAIGYRQTLDFLHQTMSSSSSSSPPSSSLTTEQSFQNYLNEFTTATRRYAKKQMQWFRKDQRFLFLPVELSQPSNVRIHNISNLIESMCALPRHEYELQLIEPIMDKNEDDDDDNNQKLSKGKQQQKQQKSKLQQQKKKKLVEESLTDEEERRNLPLSIRTKIINERQGKNMKFYMGGQRYKLLKNSEALHRVLKETEDCFEKLRTRN